MASFGMLAKDATKKCYQNFDLAVPQTLSTSLVDFFLLISVSRERGVDVKRGLQYGRKKMKRYPPVFPQIAQTVNGWAAAH